MFNLNGLYAGEVLLNIDDYMPSPETDQELIARLKRESTVKFVLKPIGVSGYMWAPPPTMCPPPGFPRPTKNNAPSSK